MSDLQPFRLILDSDAKIYRAFAQIFTRQWIVNTFGAVDLLDLNPIPVFDSEGLEIGAAEVYQNIDGIDAHLYFDYASGPRLLSEIGDNVYVHPAFSIDQSVPTKTVIGMRSIHLLRRPEATTDHTLESAKA